MTALETPTGQDAGTSHELLVRVSRRAMFTLLTIVVLLGSATLGATLWPDGVAARWLPQISWLVPVLCAAVYLVFLKSLRGRRWDPRSAEVRAVMEDELRQASLNRAARVALLAVLLAQLPLGLLLTLSNLPVLRLLMAMAVSTMLLGMATFITVFLFLDRE
jgi:Ca2+/Na+ antiporter